MKGSEKVIDALNGGLTIELTAINLYFIHAKMCNDWGLFELGKHFYEESMEEMVHAEKVIDRILFLEGVPEIARYHTIKVGKTPEEQIANGLELEMVGQRAYNEGIKVAVEEGDNGTRDLMSRLLIETEESVDWAEAQQELIKMIGLQNYLQQRTGSISNPGASDGEA
ncbi:bacterioferritin [Stratiformator vulcanicus]|uniref:Bacterioferritin n=1 Tax=Stratiformator vulcanicus TaxID=2527980 RepID=A0A517QZI5_9PLAN|nr:bacterioferritin [Stratiformator vulcanicus]QDT37049.1 Bacterioferritin [Stratiformator vulcanicus]